MSYIVNDNCIKCKHMDCVEVCPVDCFYEGENMLSFTQMSVLIVVYVNLNVQQMLLYLMAMNSGKTLIENGQINGLTSLQKEMLMYQQMQKNGMVCQIN